MTLHPGFLRKRIKPPIISTWRIILGIAVGLGFAFSLYALLYMGRESLRIFSFTEQFDLWTLSGTETWFYNLFIAYIAAIFGQSACMGWWFNWPSMKYGRFGRSLNPVVNDISNLSSFTLSWLSKLALVWAIFFGWTTFGFGEFPLYPRYIPVFILMIIALFFNSWITLLKIYKKRCRKWILVSFLCVSVAAFGMSFVNLTDYKSINETILNNNLEYGHGLELPVADARNAYIYEYLPVGHIGLVDTGGEPDIYFMAKGKDNIYNRVSVQELSDEILAYAACDPSNFRMTPYALYADKDIKMLYINRLKETLTEAGATRLHYMFYPPGLQNRIISRAYIFPSILPRLEKGKAFVNFYNDFIRQPNMFELAYVSGNALAVNQTVVGYAVLREMIVNSATRSSNGCNILFRISDDMPYSEYLKIITTSQNVIHELRNEFALRTYEKTFYELQEEERYEVIKIYPLRILELTEDMVRIHKLGQKLTK